MNVIKLGKKGQVSIPKAVLQRIGAEGEQMLLVDTTDDGAIVLRPTGIDPIGIYSEERTQEFLSEDTMPEALKKQAQARLERQHGKQP
jgi:AbrB family looped-hinge helix DNA binding protein